MKRPLDGQYYYLELILDMNNKLPGVIGTQLAFWAENTIKTQFVPATVLPCCVFVICLLFRYSSYPEMILKTKDIIVDMSEKCVISS